MPWRRGQGRGIESQRRLIFVSLLCGLLDLANRTLVRRQRRPTHLGSQAAKQVCLRACQHPLNSAAPLQLSPPICCGAMADATQPHRVGMNRVERRCPPSRLDPHVPQPPHQTPLPPPAPPQPPSCRCDVRRMRMSLARCSGIFKHERPTTWPVAAAAAGAAASIPAPRAPRCSASCV